KARAANRAAVGVAEDSQEWIRSASAKLRARAAVRPMHREPHTNLPPKRLARPGAKAVRHHGRPGPGEPPLEGNRASPAAGGPAAATKASPDPRRKGAVSWPAMSAKR